MFNIFHEPTLVKNYHTEYLKLINYYKNLKRPSSFVRYYNIDRENSTYDGKSESTYDIYKYSDVRFNIYDYTPSYYLAPIVNTASSVQDMRGQMMDAATSITIYTLKRPRVNDLVVFYDPIKSGEIYRVNGLRVASNALHSDPNVDWFELDLEVAPLKDPGQLKIFKHFIYDLSVEKYLEYNDYKLQMEKYARYEDFLKQLFEFYEPYNDFYKVGDLAPIIVNELVILFKRKFNKEFVRIFESYPSPYGYIDNFPNLKYQTIGEIPFDILKTYEYECLNLKSKRIDICKFNIHHDNNSYGINKLITLAHEFYTEIVKNGDHN